MASKIEFAVQMTCNACVKSVTSVLKNVDGIKNFEVHLNSCTVIVETILPISEVLKVLKSTGRKVVVKGSAGSIAGVAILESKDIDIKGVIRFIQIDEDVCIFDGTIDGLNEKEYSLSIHDYGDLSNGFENIGPLYKDEKDRSFLDKYTANKDGRITFRYAKNINLVYVIGRSIVLTDISNNTQIAGGIIARSAGLFENPKTICACDGVSIWDEQK